MNMTYRIIELEDRRYIEITDSFANVYGYGGKAGNNITRLVMAGFEYINKIEGQAHQIIKVQVLEKWIAQTNRQLKGRPCCVPGPERQLDAKHLCLMNNAGRNIMNVNI
jgi:hypothetical protein